MLIWTTHELKELLVEGDFKLRILHSSELKEQMLREANISDGALIPFDEQYRDFLARLRSKGITGPVIFIAENTKRPPDEFLYPMNALCFSFIEDDIVKTGMFINFIFRLAALRAIPDIKSTPSVTFKESIYDRPVEDPGVIKEVFNYIFDNDLSVIISFEINEYGRPVTARGVCKIRRRGNLLVMYQFKPSVIIKGFREETQVKVILPYKDINYETVIKVIKVGERDAEIGLPERLFVERRRHVRVVPSLKKPVRLFLLMPGEATQSLEVVDISQQGIGFFASRALRQGEVYVFTIQLPEQPRLIMTYGIIRFKRELEQGFRYGAELYVAPPDEELIVQYIRKREIEILDLLREM